VTVDDAAIQALIEARMSIEEAGPVLEEAAQQLDAFLTAHHEALAFVNDLLARRLGGKPTDQTFASLDAALASYLGRGPSALIAWLAMSEASADSERAAELARHGSPQVQAFLGSIRATHGPELGQAYAVWRQNPNDWRTFYRDVFVDQITGAPLIRVRLLKYDGEEVLLEGSPNSFLALVHNFVYTLNFLRSGTAFDPGLVQAFAGTVAEFATMVNPPPPVEEATSEGAPPEAEGAAVAPEGPPSNSPPAGP
jgi:hypothetical protein